MTYAIASIQEDHHRFDRLLSCFQKVAADINAGANITLMETMVDYIESFLDGFHHPKEDEYLFRLLRQRAPAQEELLNTLRNQHHLGREKLGALKAALARIRREGAGSAADFQAVLADYVRFERDHIGLEEREVLPLARKHLTEADWREVNAAFGANKDPLFGNARQLRFEVLFSTIEMMAPPPFGRGLQAV